METTMTTTYTAYFRNDAEYATQQFEADTPQQALETARQFLDQHGEDLIFEAYDGGMAVDEIEIRTDDADELAVWHSEDLALRLAARDLLDALEYVAGHASMARHHANERGWIASLENVEKAARAAIAKAKGSQP
jgi:hypothetical protein